MKTKVFLISILAVAFISIAGYNVSNSVTYSDIAKTKLAESTALAQTIDNPIQLETVEIVCSSSCDVDGGKCHTYNKKTKECEWCGVTFTSCDCS